MQARLIAAYFRPYGTDLCLAGVARRRCCLQSRMKEPKGNYAALHRATSQDPASENSDDPGMRCGNEKALADKYLLTLVIGGSSTWARTRDLRINSRALGHFLGHLGIPWDNENHNEINGLRMEFVPDGFGR